MEFHHILIQLYWYVQPFLCAWSLDRNTSFPEAGQTGGPSPSPCRGPHAPGTAERGSGQGAEGRERAFVSVGKKKLHWGWGRKEAKEHVSCWMRDFLAGLRLCGGVQPPWAFFSSISSPYALDWLLFSFDWLIFLYIHLQQQTRTFLFNDSTYMLSFPSFW